MYQAAFAWAHNNNKIIYPSNALSEINAFVRRTSNMLSAALRFGTTRHMIPDDDQRVKNWKLPTGEESLPSAGRSDYRNLSIDQQNAAIEAQVNDEIPRPPGGFESDKAEDRWRAKQSTRLIELMSNVANEKKTVKKVAKVKATTQEIDAHNIAQLAIRESEQIMNALPNFDLVDFDFKTGKMSDQNGQEITSADITKMLEQYGKYSTYDKGIGLSTTQRAIITASFIRQTKSGLSSRPDRGRGIRIVKEQGKLLYMPENDAKAPRQRLNPGSAARLRISARTQQERPERELATAR